MKEIILRFAESTVDFAIFWFVIVALFLVVFLVSNAYCRKAVASKNEYDLWPIPHMLGAVIGWVICIALGYLIFYAGDVTGYDPRWIWLLLAVITLIKGLCSDAPVKNIFAPLVGYCGIVAVTFLIYVIF